MHFGDIRNQEAGDASAARARAKSLRFSRRLARPGMTLGLIEPTPQNYKPVSRNANWLALRRSDPIAIRV
jgi:hypothetical protein